MRIPIKDRNEIASKIAAGVPFRRLQQDLNERMQEEEFTSNKLLLATNDDFRNISKAFNIGNANSTIDTDMEDVEKFLNENEEFVLFSKKQKETVDEYPELEKDDILIVLMSGTQKKLLQEFGKMICMDGTHGISPYGFVLHTILVIDEFQEGIPAAFAISNKSDLPTMKAYISIVKKAVGVIQSQVIMSDMQPTYANAWQAVMGPAEFGSFYCTWHVREAWRKNLKKIADKSTRKEVYNDLMAVSCERSIADFSTKLENFLDKYTAIDGCNDFIEYFKSNYYNSQEQWAYCYRFHIGINTNMYLEAFHKKLKYHIGDTKKIRLLFFGLNLLKTCILQLYRERLRKKFIGKLSFKLRNLRARHKEALKSAEEFVVSTSDENAWHYKNGKHTLMKNFNECPETTCRLKCDECLVCIHQFMCTCEDASIRGNMCIHVHILCRSIMKNAAAPIPPSLPADESRTEIRTSTTEEINELNEPSTSKSKVRNLRLTPEMKTEYEERFRNILNSDNAVLIADVRKKLKCWELQSQKKKFLKSKLTGFTVNKGRGKISKQKRFFATNKKFIKNKKKSRNTKVV
ncbi:uncharacterized protein LOC135841371 [Planococcus citri]|uniref:uncharacterized protein LOC135841371 n=1 Tax=Planococcus citri TaxID=170843 RepID=UPI0031F79E49